MTSSSRLFLLAAPGDPGAPTSTGEATASTAPTTSSAPASTPVRGGTGLVPAVKPNMNSTGMAGFTDLTNTIAGWALLGALAAFLVSALVFVIRRAVGLRPGRADHEAQCRQHERGQRPQQRPPGD